jgi:hypothetical protein
MTKLPNHTALKEWASVIEALGRGEQVVLIRKGGLADPHFGLEADRFYLFPTNYHDEGDAAPARVPITHWAEVVRTWQLHDLESVLQLEPLVVFDRATLETRFRFRSDQAVNVIAVRVFRLPRAVPIAAHDEYAGCRSWVSIDDEIDVDGSVAVLSDAELQSRIAIVDALIGAGVVTA